MAIIVFDSTEIEILLSLVDFEIGGLFENCDEPHVEDLKKIKKKLERAYG